MSFDRKQAILEAASLSFANFGYKATTMEQVAKMAKVGKGTIYTFFKNKDELFFEITNSIIKEMKQVAEQAIQEDSSFIDNTHRILYAILELRKTSNLSIKLLNEAKEMGTPTVIEMIGRIDSTVHAIVKEKIEGAIEKGKIKPCDVDIVCFIIVKLYTSLLFDWEERHEPLSSEEIAKLFEQHIMRGLLV